MKKIIYLIVFVLLAFSSVSVVSANAVEDDIAALKTRIDNARSEIFLAAHPIGSIYETISESENTVAKMQNKYGGTWEIYGAGRVLVGVNASESEFSSVCKTGGEKTHLLTGAESGQKNLGTITTSDNNRGHTHKVTDSYATGSWGNTFSTNQGTGINSVPYAASLQGSSGDTTRTTIDENQNHTHTITINASNASNAHNNLQPYITVYRYKRTG